MAKNRASRVTQRVRTAHSPRTATLPLLFVLSYRAHGCAAVQDHNCVRSWACLDEEMGEKLISL